MFGGGYCLTSLRGQAQEEEPLQEKEKARKIRFVEAPDVFSLGNTVISHSDILFS